MKIIVAGTNDVALNIADVLSHQYNVVLIGPDNPRASKLRGTDNIKFYNSTSVDQDTLLAAGIDSAQVFVASTLTDERNLIACLNARGIRPKSYDNENHLSIVCLLIRPHFSGIADFNENLIDSLDIDSIIHPSDEPHRKSFKLPTSRSSLMFFEQSQVYLVKVRLKSKHNDWKKSTTSSFAREYDLVLGNNEGEIFIPNGESVFMKTTL